MSNKSCAMFGLRFRKCPKRWGAVLFQTLEDAQQAAEEFGAYAVWKVRGNVFAPAPTGDIWSNESGQWLKVPKDFRCSEHDERLS